jgi:Lrp/AsnC family leucine-responsive transcriptional regulator
MLDKLDRGILQELEFDSRQSNAGIARKLKTNKTLVNYRIERMQRNNIIKGFKFISNQILLGKNSFGLLLRFKGLEKGQEPGLIKKIWGLESVSWVSSILGEWDVMVVITERDFDSFIKILDDIFSLCGQGVDNYNFYLGYEGGLTSHAYLYDSPKKIVDRFSKEDVLILNKTELEVYNTLKKNPKESLLKIASKLKKSYDTVKAKYDYLVSKGVLLRCVPRIDFGLLGYKEYLCLFNLSPDQEMVGKLVGSCVRHPNIVRYSKCLGHFNFLCDIHAKDIAEVKDILYSLRKDYSEIINSHSIIQLG